MDRLNEWIPVITDVVYVFCGEAHESHMHIFFACEYNKRLLHLCTTRKNLHSVPYRLNQWRYWLAHVTHRKLWKHGAWCAMFAALFYHLWKERNGR